MVSPHGAICASIVDYDTGMVLAEAGSHNELEYAAARFSGVARTNLYLMKVSGIDVGMQDILVSYDGAHVLLRLLQNAERPFIRFCFHRVGANLGLARYKIGQVDRRLTI